MTETLIYSSAKSRVRQLSMLSFVRFALDRHPTVLIISNDQEETFNQLKEYYATNKLERVDNNGVRIHRDGNARASGTPRAHSISVNEIEGQG